MTRGPIGTTDRNQEAGWRFSKARCELALRLKPIIEAKAKENLKVPTGGHGALTLPTLAKSIDTREELAELAGVSHGTLAKAEALRTKARKGEASGLCVLQKAGFAARKTHLAEVLKGPSMLRFRIAEKAEKLSAENKRVIKSGIGHNDNYRMSYYAKRPRARVKNAT
jgi:hypothetical protein